MGDPVASAGDLEPVTYLQVPGTAADNDLQQAHLALSLNCFFFNLAATSPHKNLNTAL